MPENAEIILNDTATSEDVVADSKNGVDDKESNDVLDDSISDTKKDAAPTTAKASNDISSPVYDIRNFKLTKILSNNTVRKSIALLGKFPNLSEKDEAIVLFEKKAFRESDVQTAEALDESQDLNSTANSSSYFSDELEVQKEFLNNVYGSYQCIPKADLNTIRATVVYPATDKHIQKYSICQKYLIKETPKYYANITLPYIESSQFSLEWVYNILDHKQETERIVFEDDDPESGFILLPDLKWDGFTVETLYLIAIPHKRNIKSLRDLRGEHLPLLRNIEKKSAEVIEERFGLSGTQLRMYFHYQPSFYHLHVHINPVRNDAPGIWCEKSHMLPNVINNLELMPDYYEKSVLPFILYDGNKLLDLYEKEVLVRKTLKRKSPEDIDDQESKVPNKIMKTQDQKSTEENNKNE